MGYGTSMLDFAESFAEKAEVEVVSLKYDLLKMYEKRGYIKVSSVPAETYFHDLTRPDVRLILMVKTSK